MGCYMSSLCMQENCKPFIAVRMSPPLFCASRSTVSFFGGLKHDLSWENKTASVKTLTVETQSISKVEIKLQNHTVHNNAY